MYRAVERGVGGAHPLIKIDSIQRLLRSNADGGGTNPDGVSTAAAAVKRTPVVKPRGVYVVSVLLVSVLRWEVMG